MRRKVSLLGLLWLPYRQPCKVQLNCKAYTAKLAQDVKAYTAKLAQGAKAYTAKLASWTHREPRRIVRGAAAALRYEDRGGRRGRRGREGEDRGGRRGRKGRKEKLPAGGGPMLRPSPPPAPPSPTPHMGWQSSGGWGGVPACVRRRRRCSLRSVKRLRRHPVAACGGGSRGVHTYCPRGARVVLAFPAAALARVRLYRAGARYYARVL